MKVVLLNGSPRKDGNTFLLLTKVADALQKEKIETEIVQVGGKMIRGCTACFKCAERKDKRCVITSDECNDIIAKLIEADGIVMGSPTYFTDVTAELKAVIDRAGFVAVANGGLFRHKVGAAVVAVRRGGGTHVFDTINHLFQMSQMFVVGSTYWNLGFGRDKGEVAGDEEGLRNMADLGGSMALLLKKLSE